MASVKYGAIVTELKGKVAGQVFQSGNTGFVLRNKGYTKGLSSSNRNQATSRLTAVTKAWRNETTVNQRAWQTNANDWPFIDRYGNTYYGSGYQYYCACNTNLYNITGGYISSPPAVTSATNYGTFTATWSLAGNFRVSWTNPTITADVITFFVSPAMSAGRNGDSVRYRDVYNLATSGDTHFDAQVVYQFAWSLPPVGAVVMVKVMTRNSTFPQPYNVQTIRVVVTA